MKIMIGNYYEKVKSYAEANKGDLFTAALIFLIGLGSFGLGRLSVSWPEKTPIMITVHDVAATLGGKLPADIATSAAGLAAKAKATSVAGRYVTSKSGTSYHFPWCPGAQLIKESNKVWFQTKEAAEAKGYKPASNCPGL